MSRFRHRTDLLLQGMPSKFGCLPVGIGIGWLRGLLLPTAVVETNRLADRDLACVQPTLGRHPARQYVGPGDDTIDVRGTVLPGHRGGTGQLYASAAEAVEVGQAKFAARHRAQIGDRPRRDLAVLLIVAANRVAGDAGGPASALAWNAAAQIR